METNEEFDFHAPFPMKNRKDRNFSCYDSPYASNTSPRYESDELAVDDPSPSSSGGPLAVPSAVSNAAPEGQSSSLYSMRRSCEPDAMNGHCSSPTDDAMEVESDETEDSPMQSLDYVNNERNANAYQEPCVNSDKNNPDSVMENIFETTNGKCDESSPSKDSNSKKNLKNSEGDTLSQSSQSVFTTMPLPSASSGLSASPAKIKVRLSCGSTELPSKGFLSSSVASWASEGVTPQGTPQRQLLCLSPPASATNSLTRRCNKRRADDAVRRSWGSTVEREECPGEFWASIQEPYDYIMTSVLLPPHSTASTDSLNKQQNLTSSRASLSTTTAAALAPFTSNPFPVFTPQRSPSKSASASGLALPSGHLELTWDPDDIMASLADYHQWTTRDFLLEYRNLYVWMIQLQLKWYAAAPRDAAHRRAQHEELQRYSYLREMFTEQGNRLLAELQASNEAREQEPSTEPLKFVTQTSSYTEDFSSMPKGLPFSLQDEKSHHVSPEDLPKSKDISSFQDEKSHRASPQDEPSPGHRMPGCDVLQESFSSTAAHMDGLPDTRVEPALLKRKLRCLENKWHQLETSVAPPSAAGDKHPPCVFHLDLELEEEVLVSWLSDMEAALPELTFCASRSHSTSALTERLHHNQVLLQDIKVHGPFVKSLVKQYEFQSSDNKSQEELAPPEPVAAHSKVITGTNDCNTSNTPPDHSPILPHTNSPNPETITCEPFKEEDDSETPPNSLETITPRSEVSEFPSTATSTPRCGPTASSHSPQHTQHSSLAAGKPAKKAKSVPKRARLLEKRYHQVFLKALEWQYYLEQVIADCKEHGSTSGSDLDEPLSKCRRLSASSCESLNSTGSSIRPQSSTAVSRNSSDLSATSSRGASPARSTSAASEFETPLISTQLCEKPLVSEVASKGEDETDCFLIRRSRPTKEILGSGGRKRSSDSSRSKRSTSREDACRKAVRRRADSIVSRRKPRRKKRRLATEVRSDEDRLRSARCARWQDNDLNISETGSYIEDDYVCMSEGDEPCRPVDPRVVCDRVEKRSIARDAPPVLEPVPQEVPSTTLTHSPGGQNAVEETSKLSPKETDAVEALLNDKNIEESESTKGDVEMTVAPRKSDVREANKINGNMESQETKPEVCTQQSSPNRAIFEFKHQDTDVEDSPKLERKAVGDLSETKFNTIVEDDTPVASSKLVMRRSPSSSNYNLNYGRGGRKSWPRRDEELEEEYDSDGLQKIIDSSIMEPDWLKVESDDCLEDPSCGGGSDEPPALETMDTGSEEGHHQSRNSLSGPTKLDSSLHQLVNAAEHLVKPTPLPSPIVSPRTPIPFNLGGSRRAPPSSLAPLQFGLTSPREAKHERVQSWLATQPCAPALLDSCDASGEMTTGESEGDSSSESADYTLTSHIANDLPQSAVSTPVCEQPPCATIGSEPMKAVSRNRRRRVGDRRRPWSVLENGLRQGNADSTSASSKHQTGARDKVKLLATLRGTFASSDPTLVSSTSEVLLPRTVGKCSSGSVLNIVPEGQTSSSCMELRGCASDSALDREVSKGLVSARVGDVSTRQISEERSESSGTSTAAAAEAAAPTAAECPATGGRTCPAAGSPSTAVSPSGLGVQRRRKHKIRRRSNISLHTRGSDSGSDKAGVEGHRTSISASDCGVAGGRFMGGIVKSSSFAGHPLTTPQLPSSPTGTVTGLLPDHGFVCCASEVASPLATDKPSSTAPATAKSSTFLLRSSIVNVPLRPQSYSVPLTVLSSSSDHSDKSPTGSPLKGACIKQLPSDLIGFSSKASCDTDTAGNQEDLSSHSEQAWDPFLENKYLSENYSEDLDTEAAKKFLEFGDDYRRYIDSDGGSSFFGVPKLKNLNKRGYDQTCTPSERSLPSSRLTDPIELEDITESPNKSVETAVMKSPEVSKNQKPEEIPNGDHLLSDGVSQSDQAKSQCSQASEKRTKNDKIERRSLGHSSDLSNRSSRKHREASRGDLDSDSDIEDIVNLIKESRSHLVVAENVLSKHSDEEASLHLMDYTEVLSLCSTNLDGLPDLLSSLQRSAGAHHHISSVNGLIQRWESVQHRASSRQQQSQNLHSLHSTIKQLHMKLDALQQHYSDTSNHDGGASSSGGCHSASASAVGVPSESGASAADDVVSVETRSVASSSSLQSKATADVHSLQQLRDRLAIAQAREDRLSEIQDELSQLNMNVHRHTVENGQQLPLFQHQLQHLYQKADHLGHCIREELSQLCSACAAMEMWNKQADELRRCLQQDDAALSRLQQAVNGGPAALSRLQLQQEGEGDSARASESFSGTTKGLAKLLAQSSSAAQASKGEGGSTLYSSSSRLSDSGTSGYESCSSDDLSERERRLDALKRLAAQLESTLHPHSLAWTNIKKTICSAESELSNLQKRCRDLLMKTAERVAPAQSSSLCSRTSRRRGSGNQSRICRSNRSSPSRSNRAGVRAPKNGWLWRVVRFALPIQAALLLLLCVSCLLEPSCCDSLNNLNLDLGPQVRFVHGLPPV